MKQIERYIFGRIASLTLWAIASITILSLTTQILLRVDILTTSNSALLTFVKLAATLIPEVLLVIMPFALLVGIGRILTTMNDDSELVVIEAAGASGSAVAKPVLLFSFLIGLAMLFVANIVSPRANQMLYATLSNANTDILSLAVSSGTFMKVEDGLHIQIARSLPGGGMGGIFLSDVRDPSGELIYYAKSGVLQKTDTSSLLLMRDGEVHRSELDSDQISIVNFESYALDLTSFIPTSTTSELRPKELYLFDLLNPDESGAGYKKWQQFYPFEIHSRLSNWLYPIAFGAIMASFLGRARSHRGEQLQHIATAGVLCVLLRASGSYALEQAKFFLWAKIAVYALPIVALIYFLIVIARGQNIALPKFWTSFIERLQEKFTHRIDKDQRSDEMLTRQGAIQ